MANNQIKFKVDFDVNSSGINQVKKTLEQVRNLTNKDIALFSNTDLATATKKLDEIRKQAAYVESAMNGAFNPKINTINMERFKEILQEDGLSLQSFREALSAAGPVGDKVFTEMAAGMSNVQYQTVQTTTILDKMAASLRRNLTVFVSMNIINKVKGSINEAYGYVKNLDTSLNEIRIVTGKSADEMDRFAEKANKAAASLGKATTDYTRASTTFYQQGLSDQDVLARTEATMKVSNTTGTDTKQVANNLTALWNGFNVGAEDAEKAVDIVAAVAAKTASNLDEMTTAMSKVASMANTMGVSEEQLAAQISTVISVTRQAPESVGTAFKTIYARIADIKAGSEDAEISLGNYSGQLAALGINVLDTSGQLKDMGDIIEEVGGSWSSYSKEQQVAIAGIMGGQRQVNQLRALFDNWDKYTDTMKVAADAQGTLQQQQDTYMESAEGQLQKLRTEWEGILDSLLSSDDIVKVAKNIQPVLESIEKMIDAFGGGIGLLTKFTPLLVQVASPQISAGIAKIGMSFSATKTNAEIAKSEVAEFKDLLNQKVGNSEGFEVYTQQINDLILQYERLRNTMSVEQKNAFKKTLTSIIEEEGPKAAQMIERIKNAQSRLLDSDLGKGNSTLTKLVTEQDVQKLDEYDKKIQQISNDLTTNNIKNNFSQIKQSIKETFGENNEAAQTFIQSVEDSILASNLGGKLREIFGDSLEDVDFDVLKNIDNSKFEELKNEINSIFGEGSEKAQELKQIIEGIQNETQESLSQSALAQPYEQMEKELFETLNNITQEKVANNKELKELTKQEAELTEKATELWNVSMSEGDATEEEIQRYQEINEKLKEIAEKRKQLIEDNNTLNLIQPLVQDSYTRVQHNDQTSREAARETAQNAQQLAQSLIAATNGEENLEEITNQFSGTIEQTSEDIHNLNNTTEEQIRQSARMTSATQQFKNSLDELDAQRVARGLTAIGQAATTVWSVMNSMKSLKEVWNDEDLTTSEKVAKSLATVGSILTMVVMTVNALAAAELKETAIKVGGVIADGAKVVSLGILAAVTKLTGIQFNFLAASEVAAETAAVPLLAIILPITIALVAIAAVIALIVVGIKKYIETHKTAVDNLAEANKKLKEAQESFSEMKKELEDYKDAKKGLEELTKGTTEYAEAVTELNSKILELIEKYPELREFMEVGKDGVLVISDEGLEKLENIKKEEVNQAQRETLLAGITTDQDKRNLDKKYNIKFVNDTIELKGQVGATSEDIKEAKAIYATYQAELDAMNSSNKTLLTSYLSTFEELTDYESNQMEAVIEQLWKQYDGDLEKIKKAVADTQGILNQLDYNKQTDNYVSRQSGIDNITSIMSGDYSSVSSSDFSKIWDLRNADNNDKTLRAIAASTYGEVTEETLDKVREDSKKVGIEIVKNIDNLGPQLQEAFKRYDFSIDILENLKDMPAGISSQIKQGLLQGLSNLDKDIDANKFTELLANATTQEGLEELNGWLKQTGIAFESLPEDVQNYINALERLNSTTVISTDKIEGFMSALGKISTLKFGSEVSEKDFEEIEKSLTEAGIKVDDFFTKVGKKYKFIETDNENTARMMKQIFEKRIEEMKEGFDSLQEMGDFEVVSAFSINKISDDVLDAIEGWTSEGVKELAEKIKNGEKLSPEELENWKFIQDSIKQLKNDSSSGEEVRAKAADEFIGSYIHSLRELDKAIDGVAITEEDAERNREQVRKEELQSLEISQKAYEKYVESLGKDLDSLSLDEEEQIIIEIKLKINKDQVINDLNETITKINQDPNKNELTYTVQAENVKNNLESLGLDTSTVNMAQFLKHYENYLNSIDGSYSDLLNDLTTMKMSEEEAIALMEEGQRKYQAALQQTQEELRKTSLEQQKVALEAQKSFIENKRGKIENRMAHTSGGNYLALRGQKDNYRQQEYNLMTQIQGITSQTLELDKSIAKAKAMTIMEDAILKKYEEASLSTIEAAVSAGKLTTEQASAILEIQNAQIQIEAQSLQNQQERENFYEQQYVTLSKIADEQRAIEVAQKSLSSLEKAAEHLEGDALLQNLREQRKLRQDIIAQQKQQIEQSKQEQEEAMTKFKGILRQEGLSDIKIELDAFNGISNLEEIFEDARIQGSDFAEELLDAANNVNDLADQTKELENAFDDLKNSIEGISDYNSNEKIERDKLEKDKKDVERTLKTAKPGSKEYADAQKDLKDINNEIKKTYESEKKDLANAYFRNPEDIRKGTVYTQDDTQALVKAGAKVKRNKYGKISNLEEIEKWAGDNKDKLKDFDWKAFDDFVKKENAIIDEYTDLEDKIADIEAEQAPGNFDEAKEQFESYKASIDATKKSLEILDKEIERSTGDEYIAKLEEKNKKQQELVQLYDEQAKAAKNVYTEVSKWDNSALGFSSDESGIMKDEKTTLFNWSEETGDLLNEFEIKEAAGYNLFSPEDQTAFDEWLKKLKEAKKDYAALNLELKETNLKSEKFQAYTQGIQELEREELALKGAQQKLNAEMQKTNTYMSKLQDDASFLTGDDLVANLEAQISCMQQQQTLNAEKINQSKQEEELAKKRLELEKKKVEEAEKYLEVEARALKQKITNLLTDQGISADQFFGKDGALDYDSLQKTLKAKGIEIEDLEKAIKNYQTAFNDLNNAKKSSTQAEQTYANAINNTNQQLSEQDKLNNQILQKQQEIAKEKLRTAEAAIKRETSAQHGLSKELKDVEKTIKKIQKEQNELTGPALIAKIQEEIAAQEKKKQILEKQLRLMIEQLKAMAQLYSMHIQEQYGIGVGFQVDETGVSNLDELYSALEGVSSKLRKAATEDITNFISQLNSMASSVSSAQDAIDDLSDSIEDLQKKEKETAEDEAFRVKEEAWQREEIILKRINKELSHLQSLASHLWGTALINNLERQQSLLQQQAAAEQSKLSSMRQQLQVMAAMLAARGAMVSDGVVENYAEVYASGDQKLIQLISSYQSLYNSIIDLEQSIQDSSDKIFDIEFQKAAERLNMFKTKIDIELDLTKATRQWENFKREFLNTLNRLEDLNDSIYEKSKQAVKDIVSISNTDVGMLTSTVNTIINEINLMKGGGFSSLYGWDQKAAMDDLGNYRQQLQDALSEIHEKTKQVYDSYIEQMQKIANAFSEQQDSFSKIQSIIEHDMNLIKILKGAESYDALANYYDKSTKNYELQIQKLRDQVDFWKNIMDNAEVGSKKWEEAQKNWQAAIASLNSTVDAALENLVEKYDNLIKKVINDFKKEMTGGEDLNWIKEKWDMQNKEADLYLDKITKEYNIQKLQYNYQKEIDKLNNPTQRQKLLKIMNEEVNKLKEKDKLTKYDVDRANKVYQLKMKQFEMENAQNNKTKMRLRRDAEGNYRYEYVADENKVQELKQDILDLEEEIRQFDISQIKTQKEKYIAEMEDFYNKMDELTKQKQDGLIDEAEWERRVEVLKNHFLEMTGGISDIIDTSKDNLIDSTTTEMLDLTMITEDALNEMSREAIETMVDEITPQYEDSVDRLTEKFSEYAEITESLVETLKDVFRDYDNEIQQIGLSAGVSFETVVAGIDQTIDETYNLIDAQDGLIDKYEQELDAIDRLISELQGLEDQYRAVYEAAMDAVNAALKMRMGDTSPDGGGSGGLNGSSSGPGGNNSGDTSKSPEDKKKERAAELLGMSGGDQVYVDTKSDEWYIFDTYSDGYNRYRLIHRKNSIFSTAFQEGFIFGGGTKQEMEKLLADVSKNGSAEAKKRGAIAKFDTGGYTGKWGTEGKIAMLHEKELILNQNDTANILDAVKYSRSASNQNINVVSVLTSIERTVQGIYEAILNEASNALLSAAAASTSINNQSSNITNTINANFPNAGNMNEIQNALMNLPNYTSQKLYTNSRIK